MMISSGTKNYMIPFNMIRWTGLDVFWSRDIGTLSATISDSKKLFIIGMSIKFKNALLVMGPFLSQNNLLMVLTEGIFLRSLDKGRHQNTLSLKSVRKMCSTYFNMWYVSKYMLTTNVIARGLWRTYITFIPRTLLGLRVFLMDA